LHTKLTISVWNEEKVDWLLPTACPRNHEQSFSLVPIGSTLFSLSHPAQKEVFLEI
jgi:hypothetical protein